MTQQGQPILNIQGLCKAFPGVQANDQVDLVVRCGEIHALLGENGAGKSTLMKVIYGMYAKDEGEVAFDGAPLEVDNPKEAIARGIGMIHQHFMLVPAFSVLENIIMGLAPRRGIRLERDRHRRGIEELVRRFDIRLDLDARVEDLSVGMQQKVEIVKVLYRDARFLILDEPTSVLTPQEIQGLFRIILRLRDQGTTVIFISHKLEEVLQISDRITVLRDGRVIQTVDREGVSQHELSAMMVGRDVTHDVTLPDVSLGPVGLSVEKVSLRDKAGRDVLRDVSFSVRQGEIFGIAGVDGNGQGELAGVLWGTVKPDRGVIRMGDRDISGLDTRQRMEAGMAYIPSDRKEQGLIGTFDVSENLVLDRYYRPAFRRRMGQDRKAVREHAQRLVQEYRIKTPSLSVAVKNLSGGNQQKMILSRAMSGQNEVYLIAQPTWGLDIGAIQFVYNKISELKEQGKTIVLISTDLEEIRSLSDRMCVIYEGEVSEAFAVHDKQVAEIGLLMAGAKKGEDR